MTLHQLAGLVRFFPPTEPRRPTQWPVALIYGRVIKLGYDNIAQAVKHNQLSHGIPLNHVWAVPDLKNDDDNAILTLHCVLSGIISPCQNFC